MNIRIQIEGKDVNDVILTRKYKVEDGLAPEINIQDIVDEAIEQNKGNSPF
jgi:hypothetical protein